jgi:hypothetical protein
MTQVLYEALESLAERHIPKGRHKILHVDSREMWIELMVELLEKGTISKKLSILTKCAVGWEVILTQKISIQN